MNDLKCPYCGQFITKENIISTKLEKYAYEEDFRPPCTSYLGRGECGYDDYGKCSAPNGICRPK